MEIFLFTADEIFRAVKTESSLFAQRQVNGNGESLFNGLVFDEEYKDNVRLFRSYFFEAQSEIISIIPDSVLADSEYTFIDEDAPDDFTFTLKTQVLRNPAYNKVVSIKAKEAIVSYIMYRWLETKLPEYAAIYKGRYKETLNTVRMNIRRVGIGKIRPFPY